MNDPLLIWDGFAGDLKYSSHMGARYEGLSREELVRLLEEREQSGSTQKFVLAFKACPDPILITRQHDGKILEANEAFDRVYGVPASRVVGRSTVELGIWCDAAAREKMLQILKTEGWVRNFECQVTVANGARRTGMVSAEPISIDGEDCLVVVFRDVTVQKEAEQALRDSEERYRNFVVLSGEGIFRLDFDREISVWLPKEEQAKAIMETGFIGECNDAAARNRGWTNAAQMQGRRVKEIHQVDNVANQVAVMKFIEAGYRTVDTITLDRDASGNDVYSLNNAVGILHEGCLRHIWAFQRNVTERVQAEKALRESETRFQNLAAAAFEGIGICEAGRIVDVNDQLAQMLGRSRDEMIGRAVMDCVAPESREYVTRMVQEGQRGPYEHLALRKDGTVFPVEASARNFVSNGRQLRITSVRDITGRKAAEQALHRAEREALAAQEEFAQRLISAQEQERKRLANELHDSLGQNLSLIKNRAYLALQQPGVPPAAATHVEAITEVVTDAINEVRNLAHNLRPLHIDQFGLTGVLADLAEQVGESAHIEIERRLENVDDLFHGEDATHIYRIVQESLNNLIKHSKATRGKVSVERDLHCVRVRIEDNGRGFDKNAIAALRRNRTGIGLTSISERVRMLGGLVNVDSAVNKGTRLLIELPVPTSESPKEQA
jgi:PAS domain S-box-containing protein